MHSWNPAAKTDPSGFRGWSLSLADLGHFAELAQAWEDRADDIDADYDGNPETAVQDKITADVLSNAAADLRTVIAGVRRSLLPTGLVNRDRD